MTGKKRNHIKALLFKVGVALLWFGFVQADSSLDSVFSGGGFATTCGLSYVPVANPLETTFGKIPGPTYYFKSVAVGPAKRNFAQLDKLTLASYNMENNLSQNFKLTEPNGKTKIFPAKPVEKLKGIAAHMNYINPDIMAGIEIGDLKAMTNLDDQGLNKGYSKLFFGGKDKRIGIGLFVKDDLNADIEAQSLQDVEHVYFGKKEILFSRPLVLTKFYDAGSMGKKPPRLIVMVAHFKSQRPEPNFPRDLNGKFKRLAQAEATAKVIKTLKAQYPYTPVFLMGDFNANVPLATEFNPLRQIGLVDMFDYFAFSPGTPERTTQSFFSSQGPIRSELDAIWNTMPMAQSGAIDNGGVVRNLDTQGNPIADPYSFSQRRKLLSDHNSIKEEVSLSSYYQWVQTESKTDPWQ